MDKQYIESTWAPPLPHTFFLASSSSRCFWKGVFFLIIENDVIFSNVPVCRHEAAMSWRNRSYYNNIKLVHAPVVLWDWPWEMLTFLGFRKHSHLPYHHIPSGGTQSHCEHLDTRSSLKIDKPQTQNWSREQILVPVLKNKRLKAE